MNDLLDVGDAAEVLGVSPVRVRQLINHGDLEARKLGRSWVLDEASVRQRAEVDVPAGRPYGARQVWRMAAIAEIVADDHVGDDLVVAVNRSLSPQARWKLRHYLTALADEPSPRQVSSRIRKRSQDEHDLYAHPSILPRLADDPRLLLSGVHAAHAEGSDLVPDDFVDAYVDPDDVSEVVDEFALAEDADAPNVRLRVVGEPQQWWRSLCDAVGPVGRAPALLVVADLSERDDARAGIAAGQLWADLREKLRGLRA